MYKKPYQRGAREHRHVYFGPVPLNPADFKTLYELYNKVWTGEDIEKELKEMEEKCELESKTKAVSNRGVFFFFYLLKICE